MQEAEEFRRLAGIITVNAASLQNAATQIEWTKAFNELANYSDPASPGRPSD